MKRIIFYLPLVLMFVFLGIANAAVIGFDGFSQGANINGINLGGVIITGTDDIVGIHAYGSGGVGYVSPYNAIAASSWTAGRYLTFTFDNPVALISITGGDSGGDTDRFSMGIFDSGMTSLGYADTGVFSGPDPLHPLVTTFGDYRTLDISSVNNNIKYMILTQVTWGSAWDDLRFENGQAPIPEPTTMLLLGSGLIGLAGYGRKKFFKK